MVKQSTTNQSDVRVNRRTREQALRLVRMTEAQVAIGWGIIIVLATILGSLYLRQASRTAQIGRQVQILQNSLEDTKRENEELERRITQAQSLDRMRDEANRLGFAKAQAEDIEYLIVPDYPVENILSTTSYRTVSVTPAPPIETMQGALWRSVGRGMTTLLRGEAR